MPRTRSIAWSELKLGIVGITAAALTVLIIIAVSGQGGFFWQRYPLKAQFANAQGLKTGALVRLSGKDIGRSLQVDLFRPFRCRRENSHFVVKDLEKAAR